MHLWIDADACPLPVKTIVCKAAERLQIQTTFLANHWIQLPASKVIRVRQVEKGFDVADYAILADLEAGDVVVTQDIPLASEVVSRGGLAINPRGTLYTADNMHGYLVRRNRAEEMRAIGFQGAPIEPYGKKHSQAFANALDKVLHQCMRKL
ncbi:YaiI/YqxD family protein [Litorivicinus sp.]|jgi:uncharacterized protein YaiI (UPF0178 family)|nr:YaiI/YqxD family protein [Litorivicinus sp.]MDC1240272.1 YaiI/YqxD family protein [Litorivicinus sp.]MDC1466732.1 YaiI/YqxD family protein [Litorivicinus sp.]